METTSPIFVSEFVNITVPPYRAFAQVRQRSGPTANPSSQKLNCLQFNFATLDWPQTIRFFHRQREIRRGHFKSESHARPSFCQWHSRNRATDSRSHLPMSAEPFLVSERVAENVRATFVKIHDTRARAISNCRTIATRQLCGVQRHARIFYRSLTNMLMSRAELRTRTA